MIWSKKVEVGFKPLMNEYYTLRGFTKPVKTVIYECPQCRYALQLETKKLFKEVYCDRCGTKIDMEGKEEVKTEEISYKDYCIWVLNNWENYKIYEIQDKRFYCVVVLQNESYLTPFIQANSFMKAKYKEVGKRELNQFLSLGYNDILITWDQFYAM